MSEIWDDRRKALENEYFKRREREAIEKLRGEMSAEAQAAAAPQCPRGHGPLTTLKHEEIEIDRCEQCCGVWLDAGELERLTAREKDSWASRFLKSFTD